MIEHGFDLESTGPAPDAPPPPGRRSRWRPGGSSSDQPLSTPPEHGRFWRTLCGGRLFYALSALMSAAALMFIFNPHFGSRQRFWFWDVLRDANGAISLRWTQDLAFVVILLGLTLGYLTAALIGRTRGRGLFALLWVAVAFVAFTESRDQLRFFVPFVLTGAAIGGLLFAGYRGRSGTRLVIVTTLLMASYLFMPLPPTLQDQLFTRTPRPDSYRSIAVGVIQGHAVGEHYRGDSGEAPGQLEHSWFWFRAWLPQHVMLLVFALGLLWIVGLRGSWLPPTAATAGLVLVVGMLWMGFLFGVEDKTLVGAGWPDAWAGMHHLGPQLTGRFLCSLLALAAALGDLASSE